jgi:hypothetical protein
MAIGNQPSLTGNVASKTISITATASQTLFTVTGGYRINQLSVYRNGTRLVDSLDYTARDGSSVTLLSPATLYDVLEFQVFDDFRVADALNVNSGGTVNGNVTVIGIVSATSFVGALTGTATGLSGTPNITVGVVTATEFDISGSSNTLNAGGLSVGVATATTFVGALTGNATGLSGTPNITVNNVVAAAGTFTNLTVNGTQTIVNTTSLEITDKNIGIGSTSSPTDALADGAGITIYGTTNKTITWENDTGCFEYNQPSKFKGVIETVSTGSTYDLGGGKVVLELDVRNATTYTHSLSNGSVGIVSFKNMPADTNTSNGTTITVIFTQNATGTANTTAATGIGTNCFVVGFEDGATVAGISTRALVGSATTVTLSTTANDRDFVSFFVHYTGGTNTVASSYQVYATKNGGFRQGTVGV